MKGVIKEFIGILFYIGMVFGGYYFIIKFVQLGLPYFGENFVGLDRLTIAWFMILMAILSFFICFISGILIDKYQWSIKMKFVLLFIIGFFLTPLIAYIRKFNTYSLFLIWIILFSVIMGFLTPIALSFVGDFVRPKYRGYVAGLATALIYSLAIISPFPWTTEGFLSELFWGGILGGPIFLIFFIFLIVQHDEKEEIRDLPGRFSERSLIFVLIAMFGIHFIDSLAFLRFLDTPAFFDKTWHGSFSIILFLAAFHLSFAILAGIIYMKKDLYWIIRLSLVLITIIDFMLVFIALKSDVIIILAAIYCGAISLYTVNMLVVWSDLSTKETLGKSTALGIGACGWLASFLATGISFFLMTTVSFSTHLLITSIISLGFLIIVFIYSRNKTLLKV